MNIHHFDSLISVDINSVNNNDNRPPFKNESFDRVLLDAPCSNLGQRPLLNIQVDKNLIKSFPGLQRKLLINVMDNNQYTYLKYILINLNTYLIFECILGCRSC